MKVLSYEKDCTRVPFLITISKGNKVEFSANRSTILALHEDIIIYGINEMRWEIEEVGYIQMSNETYITNIFVDSSGWPVYADVLFGEGKRFNKPFIGFNVEYDPNTLELIRIIGIVIGNSEYELKTYE